MCNLLKDQEFVDLKKSLLFFHVMELRDLASQLFLVDKGNKMTLIMRILYFLQTGEKLTVPKLPKNSCAKRGEVYPIALTTLMLKGAYKNDLKTRLFFKRVIGDHFHFTAFGIDWLNNQWMEGNPPTYQEFAAMWQQEYEKRQTISAPPKEEWAYINFVQQLLQNFPDLPLEKIHHSWECERKKHKAHARAWLKKNKFELSILD